MNRYERNIKWMNDRRIIYVRHPISDEPTETFDWGWFYKEGTYQYYSLFNSTALINTLSSFKWHISVIKYLNPNITYDKFFELSSFIADHKNGYSLFSINSEFLVSIVSDVFNSKSTLPPTNRKRKVIFKTGIDMSPSEKISISSSLCVTDKRITVEKIYDAMLYIHYAGERISIVGLSKVLDCERKTIHRNITEELKQEKDNLNSKL